LTVRRSDNGTIVLEGICPVEDAEPLLQLLQIAPGAAVNWTQCRQLHTAVLQIILASGMSPTGQCGDPWVADFWAPKLSQTGTRG
jgi:hypothetical protein